MKAVLVVAAVVKTFMYGGLDAGMMSVVGCLVVLPTMGYFAIKIWPNTPIGRRVIPPNPVLSDEEDGVLNYEIMITDSVMFTEPFTQGKSWQWIPGVEIEPYDCVAEWNESTQ